MAKKGLGRGVGALLGEANIDANSFVPGETSESTPVQKKGGLHTFSFKKDNLPFRRWKGRLSFCFRTV